MKKIVYVLFIMSLFSLALMLPTSSLMECLVGASHEEKYNLERMLVKNLDKEQVSGYLKDQLGEQVEIISSGEVIPKILNLLGARVLEKHTMASCMIINAISRKIQYRNSCENYNIQIKVSCNKIIIASPRFLN